MTAPLSYQKKGALWRAYKQRPTAHHVAVTCHISAHTAEKYIKELNFALRLKNLQAKASHIVGEDEARAYAAKLEKISKAGLVILDNFIEVFESKSATPTSKDVDCILRLESFLRGGPESRTKHEVTFYWSDDKDEDEDDDDDDSDDEVEDVKRRGKRKR
jgi:hypothetical protein